MFTRIKNYLFFMVLFGVIFSCNATNTKTEQKKIETVTIGSNHVGPISIGDSKQQLMEKWGDRVKEDSIMLEGELNPVYRMIFGDSHSVIIEFSESDNISGFRISDSYFSTNEKVRVGSSFKEVMDAYPSHDVYSGLEEGGYLSIGVQGSGFVFSFDPSILADGPIENFEKFHGLKVENIFVH